MKVIDIIEDVTKLKIPGNHVLLEIVNVEQESAIARPDGVEDDNSDVYSRVVVAGSTCSRLAVGDAVFMMQHLPVGFNANGKNYMITYEDNCAIASGEDNVKISREDNTDNILA
jgi:hypothetical protein